jgi:mannitol 2-dehydrogenase
VNLRTSSLSHINGRVAVPRYDRGALMPGIVHIGIGGFHRAHFALYVDELAGMGHTAWGIVAAGVRAQDAALTAALTAQEGLYTLVTRDEGYLDARIVGSLVGVLHAYPDVEALVAQIGDPATQIVSLTVTEGGYPVDDDTGEFDAQSPNAAPASAFGAIVQGLRRRRDTGHGPVTVISFDNIMGNGHVARTATRGVAHLSDPDLVDWIDEHVAFPSSMVDRIVPMTTDADRTWVAEHFDIDDRWPVMTEPFRQWVVEDDFAGQRLPLEELDVIVTDDVEPYELFKLRLLNASHSCLAYLARLVGITLVHDVLAEPRFATFVRRFLADEAGPAVPRAPGIDLADYQASLLRRFSNPAIGDQVDRLCLDGSSKFPKFLLPTVRAQLDRTGPIELAALALAGWRTYLLGRDESGAVIPLADDPRLEEARRFAQASQDDPAAFLAFDAVFTEDLRTDERFVRTFSAAVRAIHEQGVRPVLDRVLDHEEPASLG